MKLIKNISQIASQQRDAIITVVLGLFTLSITTFNLAKESFWADEAWSVQLTKNIHTLFAEMPTRETNMWVYFLTLHFWQQVFVTDYGIRFLSVIGAVAAVIAVYFLGKEVRDRQTGMVCALLLMTSSFFIEYAQEARSYSFFIFFSILSTLFMFMLQKHMTWKFIVLYVGVVILSAYSHFFTIFLCAAQVGYMVILNRRDPARLRYIGVVIVSLAVLLAPLILLAGHQSSSWLQKPTLNAVVEFYRVLSSGSNLLLLMWLGIIGFGIFNIAQQKDRWLVYFLLTVVFGTVLAIFLFSVIVKPLFYPRYLIYTLPALCLLLALALREIKTRWVYIIMVLVLLGVQMKQVGQYFQTTRKEQWREVVQLIDQKATHHDTIILFPGYLRKPFTYYQMQNPTVSKLPYTFIYPEDFAINTDEKIEKKLAAVQYLFQNLHPIWVISGTSAEIFQEPRTRQRELFTTMIRSHYKHDPIIYKFVKLEVEYYYE